MYTLWAFGKHGWDYRGKTSSDSIAMEFWIENPSLHRVRREK